PVCALIVIDAPVSLADPVNPVVIRPNPPLPIGSPGSLNHEKNVGSTAQTSSVPLVDVPIAEAVMGTLRSMVTACVALGNATLSDPSGIGTPAGTIAAD